jgi:translation initiation factor IF-1
MSEKEGVIAVDGSIEEALPNTQFRIQLDNGQVALGYVSGRIRRHRIKILPGDRVTIELSPYDLTKGRIIKRLT